MISRSLSALQYPEKEGEKKTKYEITIATSLKSKLDEVKRGRQRRRRRSSAKA
jgi:hypothetical protein